MPAAIRRSVRLASVSRLSRQIVSCRSSAVIRVLADGVASSNVAEDVLLNLLHAKSEERFRIGRRASRADGPASAPIDYAAPSRNNAHVNRFAPELDLPRSNRRVMTTDLNPSASTAYSELVA